MRVDEAPPTGLADEARGEFRDCLSRIFLEIARRAFRKDVGISEAVMERALACQGAHFQTIKGATNIREEHRGP